MRAFAFLALASGTLHPIATAQPARDLARVERQRAQASAEATRLQRQAREAQTQIASLNRRLVEAGQRRTAAEQAAAEAEERLAALKLRQEADGAVYTRDRETFESLLITAAFADRQNSRDGVRARMFASAAAPGVTNRISSTRRSLAEARQLETDIALEHSRLADAQREIEVERSEVTTLLAQQRALRTTLTADARAAERRAQDFARQARNLRELTTRVAQTPRAGAPRSTATLPASWIAPVNGAIIRAYGARAGSAPAAQGATLRARAGSQVVAPAPGEIAYAGPFRGYGNVLILNVAGGYAVVLTGMTTLRARAGETVSAGQPIGELAPATASGADISAPELYVEVRRDGQPVDPGRWLAARGITVAQAN
ncbi:MAG: peptidoglycan DD-metalloendopeptidase family protein [Caulobacterales bacterium]